MHRRALITASLLLVCAGCKEDPPDLGQPAPDLPLPDMTGLDMSASIPRGLELLLSADLRQPWSALTGTLELGTTGCPDLYAGAVDGSMDDEGMSWSDSCTTAGGLTYRGDLHWTSFAATEADGGVTVSHGERAIDGNGIVDSGSTHLMGFNGEGGDSVYLSSAPGYDHWTYSAQVTGTVNGDLALPVDTPYAGGWREDLYLNYTGGDQQALELRGDLYLLQDTFDRFDSVSLDISLTGPVGAPEGACTAEPAGYIGLRDTSAYWYEVIFMPTGSDTTAASDGVCDGCGTLFVRGVEQPDPVCVDFSWIWSTLSPPDLADFVYSNRY